MGQAAHSLAGLRDYLLIAEHHRAGAPALPQAVLSTLGNPQTWAMLRPGASCELAHRVLKSGCPGPSCNPTRSYHVALGKSLFFLGFPLFICKMESGVPQVRIMRGHHTSLNCRVTVVCALFWGEGLKLCYPI